MPPSIHWFRRDLRLQDNRALAIAGAGGREVVCVFVVDPRILERADTGPARVRHLLGALRELDAELRRHGSALVVRHGDAVAEIPRLARELRAGRVTAVRDPEPFARDRDRRVDDAIQRDGGPGLTLSEEQLFTVARDAVTEAGAPLTVYTPFRRRFDARLAEHGVEPRATPPLGALVPRQRLPARVLVPSPTDLGFGGSDQELPEPGERAAQARLSAFAARHGAVHGYAQARNRPDAAGTSRLSADLRFGCVSVSDCLRAALEARNEAPDTAARRSVDAWVGELAWRDFYAHVLWHFPRVEHESFRADMRALRCDDDARLLAAWTEGRTGYPIVDAAMRQLRAEAYMHNRCRMITAAFLTKDLHLDWRLGERWFMRSLVDGDLASNNGGWQWSASTGTDPQPYFRIFNPVLQGERHDPEGAYVRRWVPELRQVPAMYVHKPWAMSHLEREASGLGRTAYPDRIVEHERERAVALRRYREAAATTPRSPQA